MAKAAKNTTEESDQHAVEKRVDAMMDLHSKEPADTLPPTAKSDLPPLDIYAEPTSAPLLTKTAKIDQEPKEEPLEQTAEEVEPIPETSSVDGVEIKPLDIDTPQSDAAIDDIVVHEADAALAIEDAQLASETEDTETPVPAESTKHGHPIFWFIVFMLAILCIVAGFMLTNPNITLPFSA